MEELENIILSKVSQSYMQEGGLNNVYACK
jgi:hypothetical protein